MLKTYKAQIKKNFIEWIDDKPDELYKSDSLIAYVTILKEDKKQDIKKESLVDFFKNSPLFDLELDLERDKDTGREVVL